MLQELTRPPITVGQTKEQSKQEAQKPTTHSRLNPLLVLGSLGLLGGIMLCIGETSEEIPTEAPRVVTPQPVTLVPDTVLKFSSGNGYESSWLFGKHALRPPTNQKDAKEQERPRSMLNGKNADKISFTIYSTSGVPLHAVDIGVIKAGGHEYLDFICVDYRDPLAHMGMVCDSLEDISETIEDYLREVQGFLEGPAEQVASWMTWHLKDSLPERHARVIDLALPPALVTQVENSTWTIQKLPTSQQADMEESVERFKITATHQHGNLGHVTDFERYISIVPVTEPEDGILLAVGNSQDHDPYTGWYILNEEEIEAALRNGLLLEDTAPTSSHLERIAQLSSYILDYMRPSTNALLG